MTTKVLAVLLCLAISLKAQAPANDITAEAARDAEFRAYLIRTTPGYQQVFEAQRSRLKSLRQQVADRESQNRDTSCSRQILTELDWLTDSTMDFPRITARMNDLEASLAHPEQESKGRQQDPADGSWGRCHTEWFFKVNATYDHITNPANQAERPRYPLHLLDRVNTPEKLTAYFDSIAVSNIALTGRDNLRELNESLENLSRLVLRGLPAYYAWHPRLKDTMQDIIFNRLRNPATTWWGPRYVRDGKVQFVESLSMTFHMVSSLHGNVPNLARIIDHLLAVKNLDYPIGWLKNGHYSNHHEMDVVELFSYGWPSMTDAQKSAAAIEIHKIVRWCLDESLQPDGSFKSEGTGDSLEEDTSFGADLLIDAGVFDKSKRFWTTEEFPEAEKDKKLIVQFIEKHRSTGGAGGTYYANTLKSLGESAQKP